MDVLPVHNKCLQKYLYLNTPSPLKSSRILYALGQTVMWAGSTFQ